MFLFFLLSIGLTYASGPSTQPGSYPLSANTNQIFGSWLPVVIIAVFIGIGIALAYYVVATLLNNNRLKQAALSEFSQVIGTIVILVIIIMVLDIFGSAIYQGDSQLTTAVTNICSSSQLGSSALNLTNSSTKASNAGPTSIVCSQISSSSTSGTDITTNINYGLMATYVLMANVTSQAADNLNALNVLENYFTTIQQITPTESVCLSVAQACALNPAAFIERYNYSYMPFWFFSKIRSGTLFVGTEAQMTVYMGLLQMIIIIIMLFGWPYFLAAGFILRASMFTRKAGGLMIAVVIVGLLLYPMLNIFEYAALTNANNPISAIGANSMQLTYNSLQLMGKAPCSGAGLKQCKCIQNPTMLDENGQVIDTESGSTQYSICYSNNNPNITYATNTLNMYVYPKLSYVLNYDGCWPPGSSVFEGEALIAGSYIVPGLGLLLAVKDAIGAFATFVPEPTINVGGYNIGFACNPSALLKTLMDISNFYGMVFTSSVLVYVLNILMLLSAVKGISTLVGGDTSLLGLGRLL